MDELADTLDAYEGAADAFAEKYLSGSVAARFGDAFYDVLPGDRVLDVGCGPGADAREFARNDYDVVGLDLAPAFVRAADERVPGGAFVRGDMRHLPFAPASFDGVWSCASFLHVPRPAATATLREFRRVLAAEGVAFLSVKAGDGGSYHADGRYFERYRPGDLRARLVDAGFEPLEVTGDEDWAQALARPA